MRKHGMEVIKVEHSETIDHCPSCPYAERVQGLFDAYRCSQGVLEGPLYERDGCNLLGWVQCFENHYPAKLEVTACSTILGEEFEPKAEPKTEPETEPETGEVSTYQYQEGNKVVLLPWEIAYNAFWKQVYRSDETDRKRFGRLARVLKVNANASQAKVQLPNDSCWWPIKALRLVSPEKELKSYIDLKRVPQVGEKVKIIAGIDKGLHGTVERAQLDTVVVVFQNGNRFILDWDHLSPLDQ